MGRVSSREVAKKRRDDGNLSQLVSPITIRPLHNSRILYSGSISKGPHTLSTSQSSVARDHILILTFLSLPTFSFNSASFGEFEPPSVPYNLFNSANRYQRITNFKRAEDPEGQDALQAHPLDRLILQGETEEMSYFSGNYSEGFDLRGYPGE